MKYKEKDQVLVFANKKCLQDPTTKPLQIISFAEAKAHLAQIEREQPNELQQLKERKQRMQEFIQKRVAEKKAARTAAAAEAR